MKTKTSKATIIVAVLLAVITCMCFVSCAGQKSGCHSVRGMSGYR